MTVSLSVNLFDIAFFIYLLSAICYIVYLINTKNAVGKIATISMLTGWGLHTLALIVRTVATGRLPFINLYEYVFTLTWGVVLLYVIIEFSMKKKQFGAFVVPLVALFAILATRLPSEMNPTNPVLKSVWLIPHVATAILAYSSFTMAFGLAIIYLLKEKSEKNSESFWMSRLPSIELIDQMIYRIIAFGFVMQTALLITGAIWAQIAWGRYWGWDNKETWALITWLIYAGYLHMRITKGWQGRKSVVVCIIGFLVTMFTLFGVSLLMSGLHSYAR